ncbi:antibiotic biosynthesis monooxygenase family protein [Sediminicola luteus]|uniref:Antibiotic biosynthesis monooxygenase n=1 Tax=Sediminicola luteus TaxID=319238 RepID=A0A2A4G4Q0_9FLAO|nr:antibiotic biosynthesis monooxygenase [Sediminicola luteus]PCE62944.1 antibiotic biosynthesis monooxygenase [Sediminicola luteus]
MQAPYYAVIFTSTRNDGDQGYAEMAQKMEALAQEQPGFLGMESAREQLGITVSYWENIQAITQWKKQLDHVDAQRKGRSTWYSGYRVRICKVEREYSFGKLSF